MRERSDKRKPTTKRTKIAPTLDSVAVECIGHIYGDAVAAEVQAQRRALLAVARESDHTIQWLAGHNMGDVRLENTLSRLRRASREDR